MKVHYDMAVELVDRPVVQLHRDLDVTDLVRKGEALMLPFFDDDAQMRLVLARGVMRSLVTSPLTETTPRMFEWLVGNGWAVNEGH